MNGDDEDGPALVVLVNNRIDWRRVVDEGWYRIPLKHAPEPVAAWFLAFYQSRAFGSDAFHIRYFAPVLRYRIMERRALLPDEPNHPRAYERYYRIELGTMRELDYPVPSRRLRRITFIPTTLRRLREADEINDLWLGDDVEDLLWSLFRDAGIKAERRLEIGEGRQRYLAPLAIPSLAAGSAGGLAIFWDTVTRPASVGPWRLIQLSKATVHTMPQRCIEQVRHALQQYEQNHTRTA